MNSGAENQCHLCALLIDHLSHIDIVHSDKPFIGEALKIKFDTKVNGFLLWVSWAATNIDAAYPALQSTIVPGY
jgi:hypothetical protein